MLQKVKDGRKRRAAVPHPPGLWVVFFSLVALPLFGIGQMLLPGDDTVSRQAGFVFLFVYMTAAVGLLLTTSFLGLRRYLRQRYLKMPAGIALGWLKFGAGLAGLVLGAALLLPRPGVNDTWQALRYQVDYRLHRASEFAARMSPHGAGRGRPGGKEQKSNDSKEGKANDSKEGKATAANGQQPGQNQNDRNEGAQEQASPQAPSGPMPAGRAAGFYRWFRGLLLVGGAVLIGWWLIRRHELIFQMARSFIAALAQFFRNLFQLGSRVKETAVKREKQMPRPRPFAAFPSPFLTGRDKLWTGEQLIFYSYEALQAWAVERGIPWQSEQTAREFCLRLGESFPDAAAELNRLSLLYGHAAYGNALPAGCDLEPVKKLWRYLTAAEDSTA